MNQLSENQISKKQTKRDKKSRGFRQLFFSDGSESVAQRMKQSSEKNLAKITDIIVDHFDLIYIKIMEDIYQKTLGSVTEFYINNNYLCDIIVSVSKMRHLTNQFKGFIAYRFEFVVKLLIDRLTSDEFEVVPNFLSLFMIVKW